jgi:hypothetical protein
MEQLNTISQTRQRVTLLMWSPETFLLEHYFVGSKNQLIKRIITAEIAIYSRFGYTPVAPGLGYSKRPGAAASEFKSASEPSPYPVPVAHPLFAKVS